ncbi:MAG: DDE-type integrase/transposase/recombinase, partial [Polyangiaceae bacterium]|nr:DDE-type integrase/transposase/recombinase [Polyangiaceae bacterium]
MTDDRSEALTLLAEAVQSGCRLKVACRELGLHPRTAQRWRRQPDGGTDQRRGPRSTPPNALSTEERNAVRDAATSPEFRNASPKQIVPKLADRGVYLASESTFYRILHVEGLMAHRGASRPRVVRRPDELVADGPNQVWSWDITYLPSCVRGQFFYLYLFVDVWSRRIVAARVCAEESSEHAARVLAEAIATQGVEPHVLALHADNGGPMKGSTMLATMQALGVVPS